jgi:hypothetical protein
MIACARYMQPFGALHVRLFPSTKTSVDSARLHQVALTQAGELYQKLAVASVNAYCTRGMLMILIVCDACVDTFSKHAHWWNEKWRTCDVSSRTPTPTSPN